jgi:hypothetical protein
MISELTFSSVICTKLKIEEIQAIMFPPSNHSFALPLRITAATKSMMGQINCVNSTDSSSVELGAGSEDDK